MTHFREEGIFLREHNRIAKKIQEKNPELNDEEIYQKTRRLVIAEMQKITYGEYLPVVLGDKAMAKYKLEITDQKSKYNKKDNAGVANAFSTAAYRFGHSLINGLISLVSETTNEEIGNYVLGENFFNVKQLLVRFGLTGVDKLIAGLITQSSQAFDCNMSPQLTNFLFRDSRNPFGQDLMARNVHRGRDHGLPGYNKWRSFCGKRRICSWNNRPKEIDKYKWAILQQIYDHPDDIDLFAGGIAEDNVPGAVTGPIFNCIKGKQFASLRFGDRFFFTHKEEAGEFTHDQLEQIRKRTLADVICDNTRIQTTKTNVFLLASTDRPCTESFDFDFDKFANL